MQTRFPEVINNSLLKAFKSCPHKCMRQYLQGLRPINEPLALDLHFGHCIATALETARRSFFENGATAKDAMEVARFAMLQDWTSNGEPVVPKFSNKTFSNLMNAFEHYFATWPLYEECEDHDLVPTIGGIEYGFQFELPFKHPHTGKPLMYVGRMDMLALDSQHNLVVVDDKTAGRFSDVWYAQWTMNTQFTGYLYAVNKILKPSKLPTGMARAVAATSKSIEHAEVRVYRSEHALLQWEQQLHRDVARMLQLYDEGFWDRAAGDACVEYARPCDYMRLCSSPNPEAIAAMNYEVRFYDPVKREDWQPK